MRPALALLSVSALVASQAPHPPRLSLPVLAKAPSMAADADLSSWEGSLVVSGFGMMMPDDKGVNRWPTVAHVAFGPDALYAAVEALDPEPAAIHAFRHKRDEFGDIDFVGLDLDPTGKGQSLIRLLVTPLGGQMDGIASDNGEDYSYDLLWDSVGLRTPRGYLVKFRVPYSSLRRSPGDWRLRFLRVIPRERRYGVAWPPMSNDVQCNVCQAALVAAAPGGGGSAPFLAIPSLVGQRVQDRSEDAAAPARDSGRLGLDLRYAGSALTLEGTWKPDFNLVDTDVDPLQVNSRFKVFYPEKRPFFLEGMDLLGVQGAQRQFFSRAVVDPLYGVKASGTADLASWTVLTAKDRKGGALVGGLSEDGGPAGYDLLPARATAAAVKFRLDGQGSGITLVGTDTLVLGGAGRTGGQSGGAYLDTYLGQEFRLIASGIQSCARLPEPDGAGQGRRGTATSCELDWNTRNWYAYAGAQGTSPDLQLLSGFIDLQGYRRAYAGLGWTERWNQGRLAQAQVLVRGSRLAWWDGQTMDRGMGLEGTLETAGRWNLKVAWDLAGRSWADDRTTSAATRNLALTLRWRRWSWAQTYAWCAQGRSIDLDTGEPVRTRTVALGSSGNVDSIAYTFALQRTDLDGENGGGRRVRAREAVAGATWSLPLHLFLKSQAFVVAYDGAEADSVDRFLKLFLIWQPNAFTSAYLGWSGQRRRSPDDGIQDERMVLRGLYAKVAYAFQF